MHLLFLLFGFCFCFLNFSCVFGGRCVYVYVCVLSNKIQGPMSSYKF